MAFHFASFTCLLVLTTTMFYEVEASSRGWFGRKQVGVYSSMDGICASSVIIHGYKCQELEVRV